MVLDAPWSNMTPVSVGQVQLGVGTPATHVTFEHNGSPVLRVDVFEAEPAVHALSSRQPALPRDPYDRKVAVCPSKHVHHVHRRSQQPDPQHEVDRRENEHAPVEATERQSRFESLGLQLTP